MLFLSVFGSGYLLDCLSQKHLARKLGIEGVLVLQVLLDYGTPGAVNWLCGYL